MATDISDLKLLRRKTESGMVDCLRALEESGGDLAAAEALLKARGLAAAAERSSRETREGRIFLHGAASGAVLVELACETDFVARNERFIATGRKVAGLACARRLESPDAEMEELVAGLAAVVKENLSLRRIACLAAGESERVEGYVHGEGRVGSLVLARAEPGAALADGRVRAFLHDLALQVAAFKPRYIGEGSVPGSVLAEMASRLGEEVEGDEATREKSGPIKAGIVAGRTRKRLSALCLMSQGFLRDEDRSVAAVVESLGGETGCAIRVLDFACLAVGET